MELVNAAVLRQRRDELAELVNQRNQRATAALEALEIELKKAQDASKEAWGFLRGRKEALRAAGNSFQAASLEAELPDAQAHEAEPPDVEALEPELPDAELLEAEAEAELEDAVVDMETEQLVAYCAPDLGLQTLLDRLDAEQGITDAINNYVEYDMENSPDSVNAIRADLRPETTLVLQNVPSDRAGVFVFLLGKRVHTLLIEGTLTGQNLFELMALHQKQPLFTYLGLDLRGEGEAYVRTLREVLPLLPAYLNDLRLAEFYQERDGPLLERLMHSTGKKSQVQLRYLRIDKYVPGKVADYKFFIGLDFAKMQHFYVNIGEIREGSFYSDPRVRKKLRDLMRGRKKRKSSDVSYQIKFSKPQ